MALYVLFENKDTLLCIYFICLLFNLQMCQIILTDPGICSFLFNRFACFWPKGYQPGNLEKSHLNGDYLKQAMRKICHTTGFECTLWIGGPLLYHLS